MLTEHLIQMTEGSEFLASDLSPEKVSILVNPASIIQSTGELAIQEVRPSVQRHLAMAQEVAPLSSELVCAGLGGVLLEVFSRGDSSAQGISSGTRLDPLMPPAKKGKMSAAGPISGMGSNVLLRLGMPLAIHQLVGDLLGAIDAPRPDSAFRHPPRGNG